MQVNTLQMFDGHWHCGGKDINISANKVILPQMRDIISVTVCACLISLLLFSLKYMVWHALTYGISDLNNVPG